MTLWRAMWSERRPIRIDERDPVGVVDRDHDVRRLGRDRRALARHRDADVGERERGRVVDAVADHDDVSQPGLPRSARTTSSFSSGVCSA